jgi:hypothetical protein
VVTTGTDTTKVPVYFFRGSVLTIALDEVPWTPCPSIRLYGAEHRPVEIVALYSGLPHAYVVREQNVQDNSA